MRPRWLAALGAAAALGACSIDKVAFTPLVCGDGETVAGEACDDGNLVDGDGCDSNCTPTACGNGVASSSEICDDGNLVDGDGCAADCSNRHAYLKASNTGMGDVFGRSVALSADGSTLVVGAVLEGSRATGIDGDQTNDPANDAGAVYVFVRSGATWIQQAYLKASNTGTGDDFGHAVALSADGSTLAVSATVEDSNAIGIGGDQNNNSAPQSGAVYVFTRTAGVWSQQAYVKASNTEANDRFGFAIALSTDGSTLAVGATGESSKSNVINSSGLDNDAPDAGAVYVFTRSGTAWSQEAYLKPFNTGNGDLFGNAVALSADGSILAVAAADEDSSASGVGGDPYNEFAVDSGAAYVFARAGTTWSQQAYVKASNTGTRDLFGHAVALSADGSTLAVGAVNEASAATGVGGSQQNDMATFSGAVYVFVWNGTAWRQQAYVKASNTGAMDFFGFSLALSSNGSTLAVGAVGEDSAAIGIGGDQSDSSNASSSGAVYVLERIGTAWSQRAYVKALNTGGDDFFGTSVALSADGSLLVASAIREDGASTGVGSDQTSDAAPDAGAVYVFE